MSPPLLFVSVMACFEGLEHLQWSREFWVFGMAMGPEDGVKGDRYLKVNDAIF